MDFTRTMDFAQHTRTPPPPTLITRAHHASPTNTRTQTGALAAGIASSPWVKHGTFYGDFNCCVASLLPMTTVYRPSGVNGNYQWCGVGFQNLPNGIGVCIWVCVVVCVWMYAYVHVYVFMLCTRESMCMWV